MTALDHLATRGDKNDVHIYPYDDALKFLDELCAEFNVSRTVIIEELLKAERDARKLTRVDKPSGRRVSAVRGKAETKGT